MGRDESGTLAALKTLRREVVDPQIDAHGGRIVKTTGDGLLLEFPSVVDAVRCVVEVQTAMVAKSAGCPEDQRIAFRVGVNLGDVIVDGDDIFGDGVNIAARLQEICPIGGLCIASRVYEDIRDRLSIRFEDGGEKTLKNIARPVHVWRWVPDSGSAGPAAVELTQPALSLPDKPSIAVLPFQNMSGDPQQEYFADGVVEDIITALSQFKALFVIARNSSFTYKGMPVDITQVGRELGVRYVLEGSIRKSGNRVRITGQLIDATTGAHIWADRFDGALEDVFELQDSVTERVVGAIYPAVEQAEITRAARKVANLQAYDYYLRGLAPLYRYTQEGLAQALAFFRQATEIEPEFALAYAQAGFVYVLRKQSRWMENVSEESKTAVALSRRAIALSQDDPLALAMGGLNVAFIAGELDTAQECISRALSLNPNLAFGWGFGGLVKIWAGQPDTALEYFARALRLSPRDRQIAQFQVGMALAHLFAGRVEESIRVAEALTAHSPNFHAGWRVLAVGYALAGRQDRAEKAAKEFLALDPSARVSALLAVLPLRREEDRAIYCEGLRRAGFPE